MPSVVLRRNIPQAHVVGGDRSVLFFVLFILVVFAASVVLTAGPIFVGAALLCLSPTRRRSIGQLKCVPLIAPVLLVDVVL